MPSFLLTRTIFVLVSSSSISNGSVNNLRLANMDYKGGDKETNGTNLLRVKYNQHCGAKILDDKHLLFTMTLNQLLFSRIQHCSDKEYWNVLVIQLCGESTNPDQVMR